MPLVRAMPNRAMNPTEAGTDRFSPKSHRLMTPPTRASGILSRMSTVFLIEPKLEYSSRKISASVMG